MHAIDVALVIIYFLAVFSIGIYFLIKPYLCKYVFKREEQQQNGAEGFFLASKQVSFFAIGCSLFASNIGSERM